METALARKAAQLAKEGWTITSLTTEAVMATRQKKMNGLVMILGIIGLLFAIIPGLLILLVGYAARGQESIIVTAAQAEAEEASPKREPKDWDGKGYCPDCGRDTGHLKACPRYANDGAAQLECGFCHRIDGLHENTCPRHYPGNW